MNRKQTNTCIDATYINPYLTHNKLVLVILPRALFVPLLVVQSHMRIDELERHWLESFEEDVVVLVVLLFKMTTYEDDVVRMSTISQPQHSSS